ncbi:hypothetical protein HH_1477 [Helicobacter hepaticus ATCC 51449]|uniref:Uncharacterized protein n=1 Tax=Helicobacter hepaticus (strain ATCC 51449 / 3B1) TaxID=235279 RepID=Q7VG47_HELHP|nr:hypothetical protein HH_1477 [Helicobacter hepaticus ATCC 51449]
MLYYATHHCGQIAATLDILKLKMTLMECLGRA